MNPTTDLLSVEDYLAGENDGTLRHEFVAGMVYATAGASERHNVIKLNVASYLNGAVTDVCRVFDGDMKLRVDDDVDTRFYYPDVFVSCSAADGERYYRTDAVLMIEVLSPTTKCADRYEKFEAYKRLPSLSEYVLIEQEFPRVEIFRRRTGWQRDLYQPGDVIPLESVSQSLTFDLIYRRVNFALGSG